MSVASAPIVAIIGRPNVGKSSLFNRIVGKRLSIVERQPGVTRDRTYAQAHWAGRDFILVDTGGFEVETKEKLISLVREQVEYALKEADVILFVVDGQSGLMPTDKKVAQLVRKSGKPLILVINKIDTENRIDLVLDFFQLGLGEPYWVSALQGLNLSSLMDAIVKRLPKFVSPVPPESDIIKVAVLGRPNVGKSSLINAILGEERIIVEERPGTTRDLVEVPFSRDSIRYLLIDTAGLRQKGKIKEEIERLSIVRSLKAVELCDIALTLIDGWEGITEQDAKIAGYVHEKGRGNILVVNKCDLINMEPESVEGYLALIRKRLAFLKYVPVLFVSAKMRKGLDQLLSQINSVANEYVKRVSTGPLNRVLEEAIQDHQPPAHRGKELKLFYITQSGIKPPAFILFVNNPSLVHFSYLRYLENRIRSKFGFRGTPIRIALRKRR